MNSLLNQFTIKNLDKNFIEWHQNIPYYGFWAFKINDKSWLNKTLEYQKILSPYLIENYQRQIHITLFTCGLTQFSKDDQLKLDEQLSHIKSLNLEAFSLSIKEFSSYAGSPILLPNIQTEVINQLRQTLTTFHHEDRTQEFQAHITLGLYNQTVSFHQIFQLVKGISLKKINPIVVDEVHYCLYDTRSIKGPIQFKASVKLR